MRKNALSGPVPDPEAFFAEAAGLTDPQFMRLAGAGSTERKLLKFLRKQLKPQRVRHSLGVMLTAVKMAENDGEPLVSRVRLAGLLHDCGKSAADALGHGPAGERIAREEFGITDEAVLSAIRWHTTGRAGMSREELIIYVADYIEPFRKDLPVLAMARRLAFTDPEGAAGLIARSTAAHIRESGKTMDPHTLEAAQYYGAAEGEKA